MNRESQAEFDNGWQQGYTSGVQATHLRYKKLTDVVTRILADAAKKILSPDELAALSSALTYATKGKGYNL